MPKVENNHFLLFMTGNSIEVLKNLSETFRLIRFLILFAKC